MSSPDDALTGFYARAAADAPMITLVKTIDEGFPADTLDRSDLPRMTYFGVVPSVRRPGFYTVRIQTDGWFTAGSGGGQQRMDWTLRMLELFDEAQWTTATARLYSTVITPGRDFPGAPNEPLRRMVEILVEVSPA